MKQPPLLPVIIATGFGAGFWPWGPGTAGAVVATVIWWALGLVLSPVALTVVTALLIILFTVLGTWATARLQPIWGDDPSRVVVDEMVGVWIPLLLAADPLHRLWWALAALLLFRVFDIVKPFGIRRLDRRRGALWVMLDDVAAGLCSALVLGLIILITYAYTS
ncbi:phosphatidylglycerophosphatase A [Prevotella sp. lc2012]|uniref:phosphatidylglycerophosphatase A family protein n=1 Tax=Prevotella sp. lc2012 TaxID=1761886 RepID=UPI00089B0D37|nr:phosphatidylglycerophosphatase A [Prevotella sp. lc2012]SEE43954.1 phosphatidylglycerophosphatase A [Prevotella sp. lc2012]